MRLALCLFFTISLSAADEISGLAELILRCSQPWSEELEKLCPEACRRWPQYCYYAIAAENGVPGACQFPPHPAIGSYSIVDIEPREELADFSLLYSCPTGFSVSGEHPRCVSGVWSSDFPYCKRASNCSLPSHPSVTYKCDSRATCPAFVNSGQQVLAECRPGFVQDELRAMHCIDGVWDYVATCRTECGTFPQETRLRRSVGPSETPWHATVYERTFTPYRPICGATLVTATVVISAAHCFWRDATSLQPADNYAIAAGKIYRPWRLDGQKTDVGSIKISPYFRGADNHFQSDIALVTLTTAVVFNSHVRPACLDFSTAFDEEQLRPGNMGMVAAWNMTPLLKSIMLPFVDVEQCFADLPKSFFSFITSDKICAGTSNSTQICMGDSGGGLLFPRTERGTQRWYLRGIVSTAPRTESTCGAGSYTAFTHLVKHEAFVTKFLDARRDYVNEIYVIPL